LDLIDDLKEYLDLSQDTGSLFIRQLEYFIMYIDSLQYKEEDAESILKQEMMKRIAIFISYASADKDLYNITQTADILLNYKNINEVFYFESKDVNDKNWIKFMNNKIDESNILLLFCSPNALNSRGVEIEWTAAEANEKPIIPIFTEKDHIPVLIKRNVGLKWDFYNFEKNFKPLYELILQHLKIPQ
jgi:hypothetical protein